ncbi:MAG: archaetidylserine decarboxylase [Pseudomonadota bacterium]
MRKESWTIFAHQVMPKHLITYCAGIVAEIRWPWFKNYFIQWFANKYRVNLAESASQNLEEFPNFQAFFTRALKPGARSIAGGNAIASPCDGTLSQLGPVQSGQLIQAKGQKYSLNQLLGESHDILEQGIYMTIYLSPKDYHRVHLPVAGKLTRMRYIPGLLHSVQPFTQDHIPNLFARNERLVLFFETASGPISVVMVGAVIVGQIWVPWLGNVRCKKCTDFDYTQNADGGFFFKKGDEIGRFQLGSTVILVLPPQAHWIDGLEPGASLELGNAIGVMPEGSEN